jgi:hypothetical protein
MNSRPIGHADRRRANHRVLFVTNISRGKLYYSVVGTSFISSILPNGTLVSWKLSHEVQTSVPHWMATNLVDHVKTGSNYAVILGTDGRVYGRGKNDFGQLTISAAATSSV